MFTGIVEELGEVVALTAPATPAPESARLEIRGPLVTGDATPGDSIAVNGTCLTVVELGEGTFTADVMRETLRHTGIGRLAAGAPVNLERAARLSDRMGGHLVQGHVDATTSLLRRTPGDRWHSAEFALPEHLAAYVVAKGSITVDGVSLTVAELGPRSFTVGLIPETLARTTLGGLTPGDEVNLEVDVIAKYVARMLTAHTTQEAGA